MNKSRRNFMGYMSVLGIIGFSGLPLQAKPIENSSFTPVGTGIDLSDDAFDPDGWL
jgi:hypothetical protein